MIIDVMNRLERLRDVSLHGGASRPCVESVEREYGISLPRDHRKLLCRTNGAEVYSGYIRLFGVRSSDSIDSMIWNRSDYWKFAWGGRCDDYWCFGETAWGDQYAYSMRSLRLGGETPVYFLDAYAMRAQVVASSVIDFLNREFLRSAEAPYDDMIVKARRKLGQLELMSHLVYSPPLLLGGTEDLEHVRKMNSRAAMICNGDLALQLRAGPRGGVVKAVEPYEDELNRTRVRLVWA